MKRKWISPITNVVRSVLDHLLDRVANDPEELVLGVVEPRDDPWVVDEAEGVRLSPVDRDLLPVHRHVVVLSRHATRARSPSARPRPGTRRAGTPPRRRMPAARRA